MAKRDYYDVLGVSRSAGADEIRSAYRKLARKYHPDVNKASDAASRFKEATEAYEVLGDPQKRQMYDQFGHAGPPQGGAGGYGPAGAQAYRWSSGQGGESPFSVEDLFGGGQGFAGMSLDDILIALGGGRGGARRGGRGGARRGPQPSDLEHHVQIDFLHAIQGTTLSLQIQRQDQRETLNVKIPAGVGENARVRVRGKGQSGGDLYLVVHVQPHPYFRREGDDIYVDVPVSVAEAVLGGKVDVPTLEGTSTVTVPSGSSSGRRLRLRGKGVPARGGKVAGDQYVVIKIVVPPSITPEAADHLRAFDKAQSFNPRATMPWNH